MKKFILAAIAVIASVSANAQDEKYYGSEQGGFAISINANPLLKYAGNMFNGTSGNSISDFEGVSNNLFSGVTMTGKYMLKDNLAIDLGLGWDNKYTTSYQFMDSKNIEDKTGLVRGTSAKPTTTAFMLKAGVEYLLRPGKRLQPILGVDVVYCHENEWAYTELLEKVDGVQPDLFNTYHGAPVNKLGLIGNVGVEYFLCQNISLGATVSLSLAKVWNNDSYSTDANQQIRDTYGLGEDYYKNTKNEVTLKSGSVAKAGANISMNFYF